VDRTVRIERALSGGRIKPTKTEEARRVDLTPRLAEAFSQWQAHVEAEALMRGGEVSPLIFSPGPRTSLNVQQVAQRFRRLLALAALPRFRLYDLRHTFATHLLAEGAPITYVAAQLGHRKPTTTLLFYAHWIPGGDKSHIDRLAAARLAVAPKVPPTVLDEMGTPKAWRRSGAILKNVEVSASELPEEVGSPGWARTSDFLINSQALYRLSYRGTTKFYRSFAGTDDSPNPSRNSRRACPDRPNHPGFRCSALDSLALIVYKC
jgi:hypothetical protein